ncbi:uncharacterized protein LOC128249797 [Octopus bimaculoides]|uniref:uncharacterized protein LOC128249797 n=1 Tax=Octopus bimaculoides TaxID=37653 RepID=UPI0022E7C57D|nr:uncharacterized protein LOC128249797 [Octopus bimaculoides]
MFSKETSHFSSVKADEAECIRTSRLECPSTFSLPSYEHFCRDYPQFQKCYLANRYLSRSCIINLRNGYYKKCLNYHGHTVGVRSQSLFATAAITLLLTHI